MNNRFASGLKSPALRALVARTAAPAAGLLLVLTLVGLWGSQHFLLRLARSADIEEASRDAAFYADHFSSIEPLPRSGLPEGVKLLPSGTPHKPARIVSPGSFVEVSVPLRAPDGRETGILHLLRPAQATRVTLHAMRMLTFASLLSSAALIATAALTAAISLSGITGRLGEKIFSFAPPGTALPAAAPEDLENELQKAIELVADERAAREFLLERHTELASLSSRDCVLIDANPAYCRTFKTDREALVGKSFLDLLPSADRKKAVAHLGRITRQNPTGTIENRVLLPDGSEKWVRWTNTLIPGEGAQADRILSMGTDISAEALAREETNTLKEAFGQMQSLARTGSLTWDLRAGRIEMTPEARRLLGAPDTLSSAEAFLATVHPDDRENMRAHFEAAKAEGTPFEAEFRVPASGANRTILCRTEVRADPATKLLTRLTCTLLDISSLRAAEADMRRELEYRKAIERGVAVGIVVRDMGGKTLSANARFCEMVGWSEEELRSASDELYWPEEQKGRIADALTEALAGRAPASGFEFRFCRKDGSLFDVLVSVTPLLNSDGRAVGILGAVTDISALQEIRRELDDKQAELRHQLTYRDAIEKSVGIGIVVRDTRGDIVRVNERFCQMFGWSREELLGLSVWDTPYWPAAERDSLASQVLAATSEDHPSSGQERAFLKKDGSTLNVLLNATPLLDAAGKLIGSLGVFTDITALQQMRDDLRAAELEARLDLTYRTAIEDATASGILVADRQGALVHVNKVFSAMVGWSEDEILQMPYPYPFCREEDVPAINEVRARLADGHPPRRALSLRVRRRDGSFFDALVRTKQMPGTQDGWVVTVADVTQVLRTRKRLREAEANSRREALLREAIERAAGVGITAMDKNGVPLYCNQAFSQMIGFTREEWMDMRPPYAFWPPEEHDNVARALRLCLEGKTPSEGFQLVFLRKDGARIDVLIRDTKLYDERQQMIGFISSITDISALQSERRRAQTAEKQAQSDLALRRAIEQNADVGIVVHSPDGTILSVNPAISEMTGWAEEEILAMVPPFPIWPPDQTSAIERAFASHLAGNSPPEGFQLQFMRKDGTRFDVLIRSTSIEKDGAIGSILSVITDVSAVQEARRALQAANERLTLAQAVARLGVFTWDAVTGKVQLDDQAVALFGYSPGADGTDVWRRSMDAAARGKLEASAIAAISENGEENTVVYPVRWPDGSLHEISSTYRLMASHSPGGPLVLGVLRDVTAERRAAGELETYNARFKIAQEAANLGVWDWDPKTDHLYWDAKSFALFGHRGGTDADAVWAEAVSAADRARLADELHALIASGAREGTDHIRITWPDGSIHEILSKYSVLRNSEGSAVRVIGISSDITEQVLAERDLADAKERLTAALDGANFGTFEHVFGVGASNWNAANYEINGIDPAITEPQALFEAWKNAVGESFGEIEKKFAEISPEQQTVTYEFTSRPPGLPPRRVRASAFLQRDSGGRIARIVGVSWLAGTRPLENGAPGA